VSFKLFLEGSCSGAVSHAVTQEVDSKREGRRTRKLFLQT